MAKNDNEKLSKTKKAAAAAAGTGGGGGFGWITGAFGAGGSLEWVKSLVIAIGLALVIRWVFAEPFRIPSGSMEPTLHGDDRIFRGDRVFVNKFIYGLRFPLNDCGVIFTNFKIHYAERRIWRLKDPQRWDIVVFKAVAENAQHPTLVKRVVGLPGERIHIANGKVYVNGEPLELKPGMPPVYYTSDGGPEMKYGILTDDAHAVVPPNCYLLLGDNSAHSGDGRYFGWVPNDHILGRVACIWWPFSRWRDFTGFSQTVWWRTLAGVISALLLIRLLLGRSWRLLSAGPGDKIRVDHVYVNRWAFGIPVPFTRFRLLKGRVPRRGELVLYRRAPGEKNAPDLMLGRVAGLPNERVYLENGRLRINGEPVDAPACLTEREFTASEGVGPYGRSKGKEYSQIPGDHFFILTASDIPEDHYDSRTVGWVPHANLVGSASVIWWPPTRWRRVK